MSGTNGGSAERWEGELYPFLAGRDDAGAADEIDDADAAAAREAEEASVLEDVRASTLQKSRDVTELRAALWDRHADDLVAMARLLAAAFDGGHKVLAFGNGGSSTDARDLVADLADPPRSEWRSLPGLDLTRDPGVVTAVANDVAFINVFVRQVIAYGEPGDVVVGFSTSGESENVLQAFRQARGQGLATAGFAGFEGGRMAEEGFLDVCVVAPSTYVPRIQEAHATACHAVLEMVQAILEGRQS